MSAAAKELTYLISRNSAARSHRASGVTVRQFTDSNTYFYTIDLIDERVYSFQLRILYISCFLCFDLINIFLRPIPAISAPYPANSAAVRKDCCVVSYVLKHMVSVTRAM